MVQENYDLKVYLKEPYPTRNKPEVFPRVKPKPVSEPVPTRLELGPENPAHLQL